MIMNRLTTASVAAAVCALWGGQVHAETHTLSLTGVVANGSYSSQDIGATHYDQWVLGLAGLDGDNAITVAENDEINATITLDELFTIPGSVDLTSFVLFLQGAGFPAIDTGTSGSFAFYNGVDVVASGSSGTTTSGQIAHSVVFFPPDNGPITFDSVTASFTIDDLDQAVSLDYAGISYTLFSPVAVPEPMTWALMIVGFGGAGAALRRRQAMLGPSRGRTAGATKGECGSRP